MKHIKITYTQNTVYMKVASEGGHWRHGQTLVFSNETIPSFISIEMEEMLHVNTNSKNTEEIPAEEFNQVYQEMLKQLTEKQQKTSN